MNPGETLGEFARRLSVEVTDAMVELVPSADSQYREVQDYVLEVLAERLRPLAEARREWVRRAHKFDSLKRRLTKANKRIKKLKQKLGDR